MLKFVWIVTICWKSKEFMNYPYEFWPWLQFELPVSWIRISVEKSIAIGLLGDRQRACVEFSKKKRAVIDEKRGTIGGELRWDEGGNGEVEEKEKEEEVEGREEDSRRRPWEHGPQRDPRSDRPSKPTPTRASRFSGKSQVVLLSIDYLKFNHFVHFSLIFQALTILIITKKNKNQGESHTSMWYCDQAPNNYLTPYLLNFNSKLLMIFEYYNYLVNLKNYLDIQLWNSHIIYSIIISGYIRWLSHSWISIFFHVELEK